jgi:hypothetical protein
MKQIHIATLLLSVALLSFNLLITPQFAIGPITCPIDLLPAVNVQEKHMTGDHHLFIPLALTRGSLNIFPVQDSPL